LAGVKLAARLLPFAFANLATGRLDSLLTSSLSLCRRVDLFCLGIAASLDLDLTRLRLFAFG
jgi:hypothetical protein